MRPILTEKGTHLAGTGNYVFAVSKLANKNEIKKNVERLYGVSVERVNIIKMPAKARRYGRVEGKTASWKKAIVTVKAGDKIPGFIEAVG